MAERCPTEQEFIDYYINVQQDVWGATELPFNKVGGNIALPMVPFSPEFFQGTLNESLVKDANELMRAGGNFAVIADADRKAGSGWKTFLVSLYTEARRLGYQVLQSDGAAVKTEIPSDRDILPRTESLRLSTDSDNSNQDKILVRQDGGGGENPNRHVIDNVKEANFAASRGDDRRSKIILVATQKDYDGPLTEEGVVSKVRRLSSSSFGILKYQNVDWVDVIKRRISGIQADTDFMRTFDADIPKHEGFDICQPAQQKSTERYMQALLSVVNARLMIVLQGSFGTGKSVMLTRAEQMLKILKKNQVISHASSHTSANLGNHIREAMGFPPIAILDDDFGNTPAVNGFNMYDYRRILEIAQRRSGILAASNEPIDQISRYIKDATSSVHISGHNYKIVSTPLKYGPLSPSEIISFGGSDYYA